MDEILIIENGEGMNVPADKLPRIEHLVYKCDDPDCCDAYHLYLGIRFRDIENSLKA